MGEGRLSPIVALLAVVSAMVVALTGCGSSPTPSGSQHARDTSTLRAALLGHWRSPTWDAYFSPTTEAVAASGVTVRRAYKVIHEDAGRREITLKLTGEDFQTVIVFNKDFSAWAIVPKQATGGSDSSPSYADASQSPPTPSGTPHARDTSTLRAALLGHWRSATWDAYFSPTTETMVLSGATETATYKVIHEDAGKRAITLKLEGADFQGQPPSVIVFNKDFTAWSVAGSDSRPTYVDSSESPH